MMNCLTSLFSQKKDRSVHPSNGDDLQNLSGDEKRNIVAKFEQSRRKRSVGEGAHASVHRVSYNGRTYALKAYFDSSRIKKVLLFQRVQAIGPLLKHPNIVPIKGCVDNGRCYVIMDYVDGKPLNDNAVASNFSIREYADITGSAPSLLRERREEDFSRRWSNTVRFVEQVRSAVSYLHENRYMLRDLKLDNIVVIVKNGVLQKIVIVDLDFIRHMDSDDGLPPEGDERKSLKKTYTYLGTPTVMSPQVVERRGKYTEKADCWSLGMLIHYLLLGNYPFLDEKTSVADLKNNIIWKPLELPERLPGDAKDLIGKLLQKKEEDRPSLQEIKDHPFFVL